MTYGIESAIPNAAPFKANVGARRSDRQVGETQPFSAADAAAAWVDRWIEEKVADGFEIVKAEVIDVRNDRVLAGTAELYPAPEE